MSLQGGNQDIHLQLGRGFPCGYRSDPHSVQDELPTHVDSGTAGNLSASCSTTFVTATPCTSQLDGIFVLEYGKVASGLLPTFLVWFVLRLE